MSDFLPMHAVTPSKWQKIERTNRIGLCRIILWQMSPRPTSENDTKKVSRTIQRGSLHWQGHNQLKKAIATLVEIHS